MNAQEGVIYLINPSFESVPQLYSFPAGWMDCGVELFPKESPPDVHPRANEPFGVNQKSAHKTTYVGMVVRENGSWESISQQLVKPMKANQCYAFRIKMCQSEKYKSGLQESRAASLKTERERAIFRILTKITERKDINFTDPVVLRIWGGDQACDKKQLLAVSPLIKNKEWADYIFKIQPDANYQSLTLEAFDGDETTVKVYYTSLEIVDANEGAFISSNDVIEQFELSVKTQEGGSVKLKVKDLKFLDVKAVSGGSIDLKGDSKNQTVDVNTGGSYDGEDLITEKTTVTIKAAGVAHIHALNEVVAKVRAGGTVYVYGNPEKVDENTIFGGKIIIKD